MSDDSPYVSLEDDKGPPAAASTPAPADSPYTHLEDEKPQLPKPPSAFPNPVEEADYRGWLAANSTPHKDGSDLAEFHTPSMGNRSVTVDGSGTGIDTGPAAEWAKRAWAASRVVPRYRVRWRTCTPAT